MAELFHSTEMEMQTEAETEDNSFLNNSSKRSHHIQWDEETIAEHDKERGTRQKIDEPNTPFRYDTGGGGAGGSGGYTSGSDVSDSDFEGRSVDSHADDQHPHNNTKSNNNNNTSSTNSKPSRVYGDIMMAADSDGGEAGTDGSSGMNTGRSCEDGAPAGENNSTGNSHRSCPTSGNASHNSSSMKLPRGGNPQDAMSSWETIKAKLVYEEHKQRIQDALDLDEAEKGRMELERQARQAKLDDINNRLQQQIQQQQQQQQQQQPPVRSILHKDSHISPHSSGKFRRASFTDDVNNDSGAAASGSVALTDLPISPQGNIGEFYMDSRRDAHTDAISDMFDGIVVETPTTTTTTTADAAVDRDGTQLPTKYQHPFPGLHDPLVVTNIPDNSELSPQTILSRISSSQTAAAEAIHSARLLEKETQGGGVEGPVPHKHYHAPLSPSFPHKRSNSNLGMEEEEDAVPSNLSSASSVEGSGDSPSSHSILQHHHSSHSLQSQPSTLPPVHVHVVEPAVDHPSDDNLVDAEGFHKHTPKTSFLAKRAEHYSEYKVLQAMRSKNLEEEEEGAAN